LRQQNGNAHLYDGKRYSSILTEREVLVDGFPSIGNLSPTS